MLGASVGDATDKSSQIPTGAEVAEITAGGGAEAAGLEAGDVITSIGGQPVESADALIAAVRSATPNGTIGRHLHPRRPEPDGLGDPRVRQRQLRPRDPRTAP